ncbi:MAG: hypothetical protein DMF68_21110 [Acidobacteria bacterium]|nr:MAG: hypothetical protein DMF68_21110 [Acidobacteriota bacterium]
MPECPPAGAPEARVTNVYKDTNPQPSGSPTQAPYIRDVELGDIIVVEGANFKTLLDQAACERKNVVLYLDGRPLKNVTAYPPTDPSQNILKFTLKRTEDSRDVWTYLLGKPSWDGRPVWVSIGIEDKYAVLALNDNKDNSTVHLNVIPHGWFIFWVILFVLLVFGFFALALKSNLLRDSVSSPGGGARRPFSLARTQAAWWFFLVLASYLFIGIITGDFSTTITGTVLGLLGISAGSAVSSAMVDANNSTPEASATQAAATAAVNARLNQLDTDIATAQAAVTANPNDAAAAQNLAALTKEKEERSSQLKKLNNQSENFFIDILSDANGVNFHRFQMAAWTLVLGILFGFQVWQVLAMPEFNGSLLAELGISAGTFVGLKTQEPTTPGT